MLRDRPRRLDRARGRPRRLLDRRRRAAHRRRPHRRGQHGRRAQHPAARHPHRQERDDRARLGGLRPGAAPGSAGPAPPPSASARPAPGGRPSGPPARTRWLVAYGVVVARCSRCCPWSRSPPAASSSRSASRGADTLGERRAGARSPALVPGTLVAGVVARRRSSSCSCAPARHRRDRGHVHPVRSRVGWQVWSTERLLDLARTLPVPALLEPVHAGLAAAARRARRHATSRPRPCCCCPRMTTIRDGAFLADDTLVASYELGGGCMRIARAEIGARAFLGNSGMAGARPPGAARRPRGRAVGRAPQVEGRARRGSARRPCGCAARCAAGDESRTFRPPTRAARRARRLGAAAASCPSSSPCAIGLGRARSRSPRSPTRGASGSPSCSAASCCSPPARSPPPSARRRSGLLDRPDPRGRASALVVVRLAQRGRRHVHRDGAPRPGSPRRPPAPPRSSGGCAASGPRSAAASGATATGCPRPTSSRSATHRTVNRGCVVQTHLFHDRIMSMDTVTLDAGATLGPHSVILPAAASARTPRSGPPRS